MLLAHIDEVGESGAFVTPAESPSKRTAKNQQRKTSKKPSVAPLGGANGRSSLAVTCG